MENLENMQGAEGMSDTEHEKTAYATEAAGYKPKDKKPHSKPHYLGSKSFLVIITALLSIFFTFMLIYIANGGIVFLKHSLYGDLSSVVPIAEVIDNIEKVFYSHDGDTPTRDEMVLSAINAIIEDLDDPYSAYFTAEQYAEYSKGVDSQYIGLGILVGDAEDYGLLIEDVYAGSPAEAAGIKIGDIIISIDGTSLEGYDRNSATELLSRDAGETVVLKIKRGDEITEITAEFSEVTVQTVDYSMLSDEVGYIFISQFAPNTAEEFNAAIEALEAKSMKSLIIDVRNNPGGYLTSVVDIADAILSGGTIVSIGNTLNDPNLEVFTATDGGINIPIVLLINENSASASEILAAAIKENGAGTLVGITTYGKGIVQSTGQLYSTDGYLKLTTSAYYTPDGNDIHEIGVQPHIRIGLSDEYQPYIGNGLPLEYDVQLQRALECLGVAAD